MAVFTVVAALFVLAPSSARACAACYGQSDSPMAAGMNWGIFSLLFIIVGVLGGVAAFFIYLARKSAAMAAPAVAAMAPAGATGGQGKSHSRRDHFPAKRGHACPPETAIRGLLRTRMSALRIGHARQWFAVACAGWRRRSKPCGQAGPGGRPLGGDRR